ncbi:hypothetical protein CHUAL_011724 [Chamberlinius hualienensis]
MEKHEDVRLIKITKAIKSYPDFPKPGIIFRDILPILQQPSVFNDLIDVLIQTIKTKAPDANVIIGIDARGFLFGSLIAHQLQLPFVPVRKFGKLPGPTKKVTYNLEYGTDTLEIQDNSFPPNSKAVIVDDLLATGGTMKATCDLVKLLNGSVSLVLIVVELKDLNGKNKLKAPVESIVEF